MSYRTKTAKRSEQTWEFANTVFPRMSVFSGINIMLTSAAFFIAAVLLADADGWLLSLIICVFQLICMWVPALVTEIFLRRAFDESGKLIPLKGMEQFTADEEIER